MLKLTTLSTAIFLVASIPAFAGLGEDYSSVVTDQVHMQGTRQATSKQGYVLHEIQTPAGAVVREYVSSSGKVFGVAWQGPWPPDLRQLLANYFGRYQQAAAARTASHPGRAPLRIDEAGLVVHAGGHMRSFSGRAFIPEMLPPGVSAEVIR